MRRDGVLKMQGCPHDVPCVVTAVQLVSVVLTSYGLGSLAALKAPRQGILQELALRKTFFGLAPQTDVPLSLPGYTHTLGPRYEIGVGIAYAADELP